MNRLFLIGPLNLDTCSAFDDIPVLETPQIRGDSFKPPLGLPPACELDYSDVNPLHLRRRYIDTPLNASGSRV